MGNKQLIKATGRGTVRITCQVNGANKNLTLTGVLFVPGVFRNLFSIGAVGQKGAIANFRGDLCVIKLDNDIIAIGKYDLKSRLYILDARANLSSALVIVPKRTTSEWHKALGHEI